MKPYLWLALIPWLAGCDFQMGPAFPERDARAALSKEGYPAAGIEAVVEGRALTEIQVASLRAHRGVDVRFLVARNRHLTPAQLLGLHAQSGPGLLRFAMNPNCPELIRAQILSSPDDLARHWLGLIDEWKQNGTHVRGPDGRWRRP
jgi:hypothetical protein